MLKVAITACMSDMLKRGSRRVIFVEAASENELISKILPTVFADARVHQDNMVGSDGGIFVPEDGLSKKFGYLFLVNEGSMFNTDNSIFGYIKLSIGCDASFVCRSLDVLEIVDVSNNYQLYSKPLLTCALICSSLYETAGEMNVQNIPVKDFFDSYGLSGSWDLSAQVDGYGDFYKAMCPVEIGNPSPDNWDIKGKTASFHMAKKKSNGFVEEYPLLINFALSGFMQVYCVSSSRFVPA